MVAWVLRYGEDVIQFVSIANHCLHKFSYKGVIVSLIKLGSSYSVLAHTSVHAIVKWPIDTLC